MTFKEGNWKYLLPLYWIIQGLILMFCIDGMGGLLLIAGSFLIAITVFKLLDNSRYITILSISLYLIYSCIYVSACVCVMIMVDFNVVLWAMLTIGFLNFIITLLMSEKN